MILDTATDDGALSWRREIPAAQILPLPRQQQYRRDGEEVHCRG